MTACYVSPEVTIVLSKEEIHKRYQDTAMIIFKVKNKSDTVNLNEMNSWLQIFFNYRRNKAERRKLSAILALEVVARQWNIATTEITPLSYASLQLHEMHIHLHKYQ